MSINKLTVIILMGFMLIACSRSKDAQFYVLNPIPPQKHQTRNYNYLRIGIDEVNTPAYIEKPQLMIHQTPHRVDLEEYHQWAGPIDKNITHVIETNLSTLLPGALIESSPWDVKFKPNYHLQIDISQFEIDMHGDSLLRAEYVIYYEEELIEKRNVYYHQKTPNVTVDALVISLNNHLTHLTQDIARFFTFKSGHERSKSIPNTSEK